MRKFDIIACSVLKMTGCRNAPAGFAMSVCLGPVNVINVESNYVCVCVRARVRACVLACACVRVGWGMRECCLKML